MGIEDLSLVPRHHDALARFGKGDERKLRSYLLALVAFLEGRNKNTKDAYRHSVKLFFDLFKWLCPEDVTVAHAVAFKKYLIDRGHKDATVYARLSAMSAFFDFLRKPMGANEEPLIRFNPFDALPRSDVQPTMYGRAVAMQWKTFSKILEALPTDPMGLRDKAILLFFAFTGRRRAELASLRFSDLQLDTQPKQYTSRVKGGKLKTFELPEICYDAMRAYWIASDRLDRIGSNAAVFAPMTDGCFAQVSDSDAPMRVRNINWILVRAAQRAGISDPTVKLHALRHMAARDLEDAGVSVRDIQAFLGHENLNTTAVYLEQLSGPASAHEEDLKRVRDVVAAVARNVSG